MGILTGVSLHARHRDGADCGHDHRKTPSVENRRRSGQRVTARLSAFLAALVICGPALCETLRIAVYHTELSRDGPGLLLRDIEKGEDPQILASLAVVAHANADAIVLADFDFDANLTALNAFADRLQIYPHRFALAPNRGVHTGLDADGDGRLGEPEDAQGYGRFAGDGGLAILSKRPIATGDVRDLSRLNWQDLEGSLAPANVARSQRLSTTGHWMVPIEISENQTLTLMTWHATPPVFDGPEDLNGKRNHDEAAIWLQVLGAQFGAPPTTPFVIAGISNLDPVDGDGRNSALTTLLAHPSLTDPRPSSLGALQASKDDQGINLNHTGDPALDTVDWPDTPDRPGNLRVTLALTSHDLQVIDTQVFWPADQTSLIGEAVTMASRHRLVWVDVCISNC
ncbi:MAG: endonuclease/exonuclease/phosphatase family protein [Boseongicola sp.]|nr:endonuclease/exonuclease/phosphatase family protein [Boseongicola sp.]